MDERFYFCGHAVKVLPRVACPARAQIEFVEDASAAENSPKLTRREISGKLRYAEQRYGMKRAALFAFLSLWFLSGCQHAYVMTLNNGTQLTAANKPRLKSGIYVFKDAQGREARIAAGRVRDIAPASMAKDEKSQFKVPQAK